MTILKVKVKVKVAQLCPTLWDPMDYTVHGIFQARILEWVAFPFSRGIFLTQGLNPGLPHCRQILYQLSHKGSPRILEWVAYPFSRGFSQPRNRTGIFCIAGRFFTNWAIREAQNLWKSGVKICHFNKHQVTLLYIYKIANLTHIRWFHLWFCLHFPDG